MSIRLGQVPSAGRRRALRGLLAALPAGAALPGDAAAQAYPQQAVKMIIPYTPAGGTDVLGRMLAERISKDTGWSFVVENRPGGGGNIGLDVVAKSKPDGYTLGVGQTSNLAINPSLFAKMPFDVLKDLTPIATVAQQSLILVVRGESSHRTLADLIRTGKSKAGGLKMASPGSGTVGHLAGELLARRVGVSLLHIPYKGASPAIADLIGGQTDFMLSTPQAALPLIKAGKLRAVAVTSSRRLNIMGDVPTVAESGYAGFEANEWKVLVGPAGMSTATVRTLREAVEKALGKTDVLARLVAEGSAPMRESNAQLAAFLKAEQVRWGEVVRASGAKAD